MKKYKHFVILSIAVSFVLLPLVLLTIFYLSDSPRISSIKALKDEKEANAAVEGGRILFNSGSNTLYGVRTKDITDKLGIPTYNLAINAGLDLDFIIDQSKNILKPGDIIILPLEYVMFDDETYGTHAFEYYRKNEPEKVFQHGFKKNLKYLLSFGPYDRLVDTINAKSISLGLFKYPNRLNDHGDMEGNVSNNFHSENASPLPIKPFNNETNGLKALKNFNLWSKSNDILLFITYPNAIYLNQYKDDQKYINYFNSLNQYFITNNIPTIGLPTDFFMEEEYFYNTHYHLNQKGMKVRTEELLNMLSKNELFVLKAEKIKNNLSAKK